jgi:ribose transport system permease protein
VKTKIDNMPPLHSPKAPAIEASAGGRVALLLRHQAVPVTAATLVLLLLAGVLAPSLFTPASIFAMAVPTAVLAIAGIGQTLVIQQKGIDLSQTGMMTLGGMIVGLLANDVVLGFVIVIVAGILGGILNAVVVARVHVTPLLVTLATNSLFLGVVWTLSSGVTQRPPDYLKSLANASLFGVPTILCTAVVLIAITAVVMGRSVFGRQFTGAGASPAAARASGVRVDLHLLIGYVASSVFAAISGIVVAGYAGQATYDLGSAYQLPVIAAVVVGGAALEGGRGTRRIVAARARIADWARRLMDSGAPRVSMS